ncbi:MULTISPECIES: class II histone deacetylase [Rhizobium/Agrobacterium group]|uniref:Class II histone deacetylase n=1 Tax=Rhizobium rhizogenes TaxID=359 RepID=A0A546X3B1_RHIRH|nr:MULTISPECIES: class II histone deacetylase [Rhizobium/Agrobacterium group]TRA95258.1 class II histone deacetylase [Rhizobium rhizogenes]
MNSTLLFSHEQTFWHTSGTPYVHTLPVGGWVQPSSGSGTADSPDSKRRLLSLVQVSGLAGQLGMPSAQPASIEDLLRIHTRRYLEDFKELSDTCGGDLGGTAPFAPGGYEVAAISAGLAISAVDSVVTKRAKNAYALSRPAGHHCLADKPMGNCLLANIPIAIEAARSRHGIDKVAIIDWDVHHGNGAQSIYYQDPNTLTISIHQEKNFSFEPNDTIEFRGEGRGVGSNLNIALPPGCGDEAYAYVIKRIVQPSLEAFRPDLIVVANGLDACGLDPMGRMLLHSETFRAMTDAILEAADCLCGGRVAVIHEGGYSEVYIPFCGLAVLEALSGFSTGVQDPLLAGLILRQPNKRMVVHQRMLIDEMAKYLF